MKLKRLVRIALLITIFLFGLAYGQEPTQKKVVAVLDPIRVIVEEPNKNDVLGQQFYKAFLAELKRPGVFILVSPESNYHCNIIFAISPVVLEITPNVINGYSVAFVIISKSGDRLKLDVISGNAASMEKLAKASIKALAHALKTEEDIL